LSFFAAFLCTGSKRSLVNGIATASAVSPSIAALRNVLEGTIYPAKNLEYAKHAGLYGGISSVESVAIESRFAMTDPTESRAFDTVDHIAIPVTDLKGTVDWYLKNFSCKVAYHDETWALVEFANIRVAFVIPQQHPPHFALLRDPALFGEPKTHRDGTRSVYISDPSGNSVEVLALK
jgi:hypothetical protein